LGTRLLDPATFSFREFFISVIGKDGKPPYWLRCILFGMILYIVGAVFAFFSNTMYPDPARGLIRGYLSDYYILVFSIVAGLTPLSVIRALRGLGDKLVYTDECLYDDLDNDAKETEKAYGGQTTVSEGNTLRKLNLLVQGMMEHDGIVKRSRLLYYLSSLGFAIVGFCLGIYWSVSNTVSTWSSAQFGASSNFFIAYCAVIGYAVGALVFISARGIAIVRRYCKNHVSCERISALSPDKLGGLEKVGQFSLGLDAAAAIPGLVFFASVFSGTPIEHPSVAISLAFYTVILIMIFFLPIYPFHKEMAHAKEEAFRQVNRVFKEVYLRIWNEHKATDPHLISTLKDTYFLHERISKMSGWPLNLGIRLKFVATAAFPILITLLSTYLSKLLGL
jgi:hypothetical protein